MFHSPSVNALSLKLSDSITYSGSLGHQFSYNKTGEAEAAYTNNSSMQLNVGTYLWRPWIATLNSNSALSYNNNNGIQDSNSQSISGNVSLNVFPQSHFPFRVFFRKHNNHFEGDQPDRDLTTTSYGFTQSYTTGASILSLAYRHFFEEDENFVASSDTRTRENTEDTLDLTMSTNFGNHDVTARSRFNYNSASSPPLGDEQMLHVLQHNYNDNNLTVNNLFTIDDRSTEQTAAVSNERTTLQFNSNAFWRPKSEKRLLVSASSLLQGTGEDIGGKEYGIFDNAGLSGSVSYLWKPFLSLGAQASVNRSETNTQTRQRINTAYTPADRELFGFRWAYHVATSVTNSTQNTNDTLSSIQDINVAGGHFFNRTFPAAIGPINVSATQRATTILDTTGNMTRTLTHSIGSGWTKPTNNGNNSVRLQLNDTRRFRNEEDVSGQQLANIQANSNYRINQVSGLNGHLTFQASKTLSNSNTGDNINLNTSMSLNYDHARLFGVSRLTFFTELRYVSDSLFEIINSDGINNDENNVVWQNRLNYSIGRLLFHLTTSSALSNGEITNFMSLQVRRHFGR